MIDFEILNGFLGMKRDIILRICSLLWNDSDGITVGLQSDTDLQLRTKLKTRKIS
jgi:hypothetical protein